MARLSIRLLGPLQVALDGEPVPGFASDKVRALLAYLAVVADRSHRREALAGLLWPDYPEASARATLRNALANLRRAIDDLHAEPPHLEITRQTLQFNRHSDHWLDVAAFTTALEADTTPREELAGALALYRGPFLDGFSLPDSATFEEWLIATREHLARQALQALRRLVDLHEERGAYEDALPFAWRQVELEPWHEEGHQQVMRLLARTGRRSEALAQYERCRQTLQDELGVEPAAGTTALYEAIRSGELGPEEPVAATVRRPQAQYHLPPQPTPFVGREEELAALEALLHNRAVPLVTLLGPGGIGKTRLALAVGTRIADAQQEAAAESSEHAFPHGVVFVPLAPLSSAQEIAPAMAEALQLRLQGGADQLRDYLRHKQLLLILDNVEHLLEPASLAQQGGAELLATLVNAAPGVKLLATSRERLQLHGEHAFPVGGLGLPDQDPSPAAVAGSDLACVDDYLESYPAIKLFVLTARRVQPQLVVDRNALTSIARLCRLLEGMPLALELAASWTDTLPLDDILAKIRVSLDFLQTEWRDLPRRQRSMRAVFDASWARLGKAEQAVFPQLSIFRGGLTRAAAEQVAMPGMEPAAAARLLSKLVATSFLQYDPSMQRFQIHELLRQYAGEKLAQDLDREAEVRDRHSQHFCRWLQQMEHALQSPRQLAALDEMQPDIENARTACSWAAARGEAERLAQAVDALGQLLLRRGNYQVGEHTFAGLATQLREASEPAVPMTDIAQRALARIVVWQSTLASFAGNLERSKQLAHEGLALLDAPPLAARDTRAERADLHRQLGYAHYEADPETARKHFLRSRDLYQELGDHWGLADALVGLGRTLRNLNAYDEAEAATAAALSLRRALGDDRGCAEALALLGNLAGWQMQFERAEQLVRESLALTPPADREGIAYGQLTLASLLISSGRFAAATQPVDECLALYTELGMRHLHTYALWFWTQLHRHLGDYAAAHAPAEELLSTARELEDKRGIGLALGQMGALALAEGASEKARRLCEASVAAWQAAMGQPSRHEGELACLALATRHGGQRDRAWRHLLTGLEWAVSHRLFVPLTQALAASALLLADRGEAERAVEVYALAQRYPLVAHSRWFEDVVGREMAAVAAGLPPDVAQAAQARGEARELWSGAADLLEELSDAPATG